MKELDGIAMIISLFALLVALVAITISVISGQRINEEIKRRNKIIRENEQRSIKAYEWVLPIMSKVRIPSNEEPLPELAEEENDII